MKKIIGIILSVIIMPLLFVLVALITKSSIYEALLMSFLVEIISVVFIALMLLIFWCFNE